MQLSVRKPTNSFCIKVDVFKFYKHRENDI